MDAESESVTSPVIDPRFGQPHFARPKMDVGYTENNISNPYESTYNPVSHYTPTSESGFSQHVSNFPRYPEDQQQTLASEHYGSYDSNQSVGSQPRYRPPLAGESTSPLAHRQPALVGSDHPQTHSNWHPSVPHTQNQPHASIPAYQQHNPTYHQMSVRLPAPPYPSSYHDTVEPTSWEEHDPPVLHDDENNPNIGLDANQEGRSFVQPGSRGGHSNEYWRGRLQ